MSSRVRVYLQAPGIWPGQWFAGKRAIKTLESLIKPVKTPSYWLDPATGQPYQNNLPVAPMLGPKENLPLWKQAIALWRAVPAQNRGQLQLIIARESRNHAWADSPANPMRFGAYPKKRRVASYFAPAAQAAGTVAGTVVGGLQPVVDNDDFNTVVFGGAIANHATQARTPQPARPKKKKEPFAPRSRPSVGIWI